VPSRWRRYLELTGGSGPPQFHRADGRAARGAISPRL